MVVQTLGEVPAELAVTAEQDQRLADQAARVGPAAVLRLLDLIALAQRACKDGADARTQLELALVKGARPEHDPSLRALLARMERLEAGRPAAPAGAAGARPGRCPRRPPPARLRPPRAPAPPAPAAAPEPPAPPAAREPEPTAQPTAVVAASADVDGAPAVTAVAVVEADGTVSEPVVAISGDLDLDSVTELWPAVLDDLRERRPMLHAALEHARPSALEDNELTIAWAQSADFYRRKAEEPACREQIADAIRTVTGSSLRLAYALADEHELPRRGGRAHPLGRRAHRSLHARVRRRGASSRRGVLMPQPPNLDALLQQAQKMQQEMMEAQEKLKDERIEATAGGGMVKVVMTGDLEVKELTIDPDAVDPEDVEMLQDMVMAAINEAMRQASDLQAKAAGGGMGGMDPAAALESLGGMGGLGGLLGGGGGGAAAPRAAPGMPPNRAARRKQR